jgi:formamidopyrimidine-DNA glycosylase
MPELPDIVVYLESLDRRTTGQVLEKVRLFSPFVLRSVEPPLSEAEGKTVRGLRRLGKRIVFELDGDLFLVLHLMIAGRPLTFPFPLFFMWFLALNIAYLTRLSASILECSLLN